MATQQPTGHNPAEVSAAAIRYLAAHGYEATTAGDLADAVGMSRSTFFRRFGSKDDVIFLDHDRALEALESELTGSTAEPAEALSRGTASVLHLLTRDPEAARLRSELLRQTPALRDRELVITHRYERIYAGYLDRVRVPATPEWVVPALAAGVVAVHNAALRRWLRDPDARVIASLAAELQELAYLFRYWLGGPAGAAEPQLLVATFDAGATPDAVLRAVRAHLEGAS